VTFSSERARFADAHARVGVMPGCGLTIRLPQLIGIDRARRMSVTGDFIDAETAFRWGLVVEAVPHEPYWNGREPLLPPSPGHHPGASRESVRYTTK
jgi:enoyl-CoA hydratase/carnithine racemase